MAKSIERFLSQSGYESDTVHCGQDAIDLATERNYDLILLDIMLPDLDGFEVIESLRKSGIETPFLVQTGLLEREDQTTATSLGVTDYLIKPFNRNELIDSVESAITRATKGDTDEVPTSVPKPDLKTPEIVERRKQRRFKTLKSATVVSPVSFECVILNISYGGASICLPSAEQDLPTNFAMAVRGGGDLKCEVCWRLGDKAGIKFLWTPGQIAMAEELAGEWSEKHGGH